MASSFLLSSLGKACTTIIYEGKVLLQCNNILTVYGLGPEDLKGDIIGKKQRLESKQQLSSAVWESVSQDMATENYSILIPMAFF